MIIPLHHAHVEKLEAKRLLRPKAPDNRVSASQATTFSSSGVLPRAALAACSSWWACSHSCGIYWQRSQCRSCVGVILGCVMLTLGYTQRLSGWPVLLVDSVTLALLIKGTGGTGSPLLALAFLLILQGGLLGGSNGALAGSGASIAILLMLISRCATRSTQLWSILHSCTLCAGSAAPGSCNGPARCCRSASIDLDQPKQDLPEAEAARSSNHWPRLYMQIAACTYAGTARATYDQSRDDDRAPRCHGGATRRHVLGQTNRSRWRCDKHPDHRR